VTLLTMVSQIDGEHLITKGHLLTHKAQVILRLEEAVQDDQGLAKTATFIVETN